jgi:membrane-associated phospholipid phosphatase
MILLISFLLVLFFGKTFASFSLNANHPFWLNVFFINYTFMGNGLFVIGLVFILLFFFNKNKLGMAVLYSFLLSGFLVQLLKNINNLLHPTIYFEAGQYLFLTGKNEIAYQNGFLSGHTAIAFALATVLILVIKNSKWQLPLLVAAILLGYSRIYLAQYYLPEIMVGAVVGTFSGIGSVYLAYHLNNYKYYLKKFFSINKAESITTERHIQPV